MVVEVAVDMEINSTTGVKYGGYYDPFNNRGGARISIPIGRRRRDIEPETPDINPKIIKK